MTSDLRAEYRPWGGVIAARHRVDRPTGRDAAAALVTRNDASTVLAYGCGRSYGDEAMNDGGRLIDTRGLDKIIAFDRSTGVLTAEAGVRMADILIAACRPDADGSGWMLPVAPGTRFVTLGGAIANDVHGKNHHAFGTFGRQVLSFELARSDGARLTCTPSDPLYAATIGGLGLTGLVLSSTVQMRRVPGLAVEAEDIRFGSLDEYFSLRADSDRDWEYTAAWIDCLARGPALGRGIFSRARHVAGRGAEPPPPVPRFGVPATPPVSLVTPWTVRVFNAAYWRKLGPGGHASAVGGYAKVLFPLDALDNWNRVYGRNGVFQFQCLLPPDVMLDGLREILGIVSTSGQGSMLSVLKLFGDVVSPGMLSFPAPGATLAMDFANRGEPTRRLLKILEGVVRNAGGRFYPAKDTTMSVEAFRAGYPRIDAFRPHIDPRFASDFARRVGLIMDR